MMVSPGMPTHFPATPEGDPATFRWILPDNRVVNIEFDIDGEISAYVFHRATEEMEAEMDTRDGPITADF